MGIDRVETQVPQDRGAIQRSPGRIQTTGGGGIAHRSAKTERETHHQLRPPGHPLGQRIQRDQQQRCHAKLLRQALSCSSTARPTSSSTARNISAWRGRSAPEASGRARGARDLAVDVAVPQIVDDAAGGPHRQAADREQHDQPERLGRPVRGPAECPTAPAETAARCRSACPRVPEAGRAARRAAAGQPSRWRQCRCA